MRKCQFAVVNTRQVLREGVCERFDGDGHRRDAHAASRRAHCVSLIKEEKTKLSDAASRQLCVTSLKVLFLISFIFVFVCMHMPQQKINPRPLVSVCVFTIRVCISSTTKVKQESPISCFSFRVLGTINTVN